MDINYELYKVFYYVATSLSFSEASKQLYISQSAEYIAYLDKTQKDIGEKIRAASFHPEHEKSTAHPCRKSTLKAH